MKNAFAQAMDMTPERCKELEETMFEFIEQEKRPSDVLRKIADAEGFTQLERLTMAHMLGIAKVVYSGAAGP